MLCELSIASRGFAATDKQQSISENKGIDYKNRMPEMGPADCPNLVESSSKLSCHVLQKSTLGH